MSVSLMYVTGVCIKRINFNLEQTIYPRKTSGENEDRVWGDTSKI